MFSFFYCQSILKINLFQIIQLQVAVIAVLTLQIAYSSGEKDTCTFEEYTEDPGHNNCCFHEPDCTSVTTCAPTRKYVWVSKKINIYVQGGR